MYLYPPGVVWPEMPPNFHPVLGSKQVCMALGVNQILQGLTYYAIVLPPGFGAMDRSGGGGGPSDQLWDSRNVSCLHRSAVFQAMMI